MEHGVAEDRPRIVLEPHESREVEAVGVVHAEHETVDERVDEEHGQDRQRRHEEQQVDGAFAARAPETRQAMPRPGHTPPVTIIRGAFRRRRMRVGP